MQIPIGAGAGCRAVHLYQNEGADLQPAGAAGVVDKWEIARSGAGIGSRSGSRKGRKMKLQRLSAGFTRFHRRWKRCTLVSCS